MSEPNTTAETRIVVGEVAIRIAGVASTLEVQAEIHVEQGWIRGIVSIDPFRDTPLLAFSLVDGNLRFADLPAAIEIIEALESAFGTSAFDIRGAIFRLGTEIVAGVKLQPHHAMPDVTPPSGTVH